MYVNITYRRGEVSNKASKVNGIHTNSYCVQDQLAGGEGCTVVVWNERSVVSKVSWNRGMESEADCSLIRFPWWWKV